MASKHLLLCFALSLVILNSLIQSAPIEKNVKQSVQSISSDKKPATHESRLNSLVSEKTSPPSSSATSPTTTTATKAAALAPEKKKRSTFIDQLDAPMDEENDYSNDDENDGDDHVLHANIQETSAQIHDAADKPVNIDDSRVYSDIQMTPLNLKNILRRRREIRLHDPSGQRRKRALSPYDFADTDSFYDPYAYLIEQEEYDRPIRSFAPLYWYPNVYERSIRSALAPSYYESSDLPQLYSSYIADDDNDDDENPDVILDDENDYESNRYPILIPASDVALDNYELQQQYNTDDLPIDEDFETDLDEDGDGEQYGLFNSNERPYYARYDVPEIIF